MKRAFPIVAFAIAAGLLPSPGVQAQSAGRGKGPARSYETTAVTVRAGELTQAFSLAALQQLRRVTLTDVEQAGTDKGPQGVHSWSGASLRDVVLAVDPAFCSSAGSRSRLKVVSQDGWMVRVTWAELCGTATGGEALFHCVVQGSHRVANRQAARHHQDGNVVGMAGLDRNRHSSRLITRAAMMARSWETDKRNKNKKLNGGLSARRFLAAIRLIVSSPVFP